MRFVVFGDDQATAGFLVETVNDPGPGNSADAAEFSFAVMQERVDESVFLMAGGRMHHESGRFVQDQERVVLKENIQRHFFGLRFGRLGLRPVYLHLVTGMWCVGGLHASFVDQYVAFFDKALDRTTRNRGEFATQVSVKPPGRECPVYGEDLGA